MVPGTYGGTGLGLAISQKLVELMEGKVLASSEVNQGSKFTIRLDQVKVLEGFEEPEEIVNEDVIFEGAKVLLVDDTDNNRKIIKDYLS